jgi:hypothetical protein
MHRDDLQRIAFCVEPALYGGRASFPVAVKIGREFA